MTQELSPQQIAAELLRRQRARESLVEYSQAIEIPGAPARVETLRPNDPNDPGDPDSSVEYDRYRPIETRVALHHRVMMAALQRTMETANGRLIILMPPGSAKSTYADVIAPTWALGKWPGHRVILASYATTIAVKQSRKARAVCRQGEYTTIWPERPHLLEDQRAVDEWSLSNGSEFMAAGLLAGITGNRANGVILDDPIANREQADSAGIREKIYSEYIDTALTRLIPNGYVILIMTRWHEDDLAGTILPEDYNGESGMLACRDGQTWEVLCVPAEAERHDDPLGRKPGEFLWPEWFPEAHWRPWRDNPRAARTWSALYQQRPAPFTGVHFSRDLFKLYDLDKAPYVASRL